jgi:large subunit ribosomal protein L13
LKGKHKVSYAPHVDNGDYIIVLNSDKISVSGKKLEDKIYYSHTGFL